MHNAARALKITLIVQWADPQSNALATQVTANNGMRRRPSQARLVIHDAPGPTRGPNGSMFQTKAESGVTLHEQVAPGVNSFLSTCLSQID